MNRIKMMDEPQPPYIKSAQIALSVIAEENPNRSYFIKDHGEYSMGNYCGFIATINKRFLGIFRKRVAEVDHLVNFAYYGGITNIDINEDELSRRGLEKVLSEIRALAKK